ncbi:hypothetical protein IIA15_07605, partial [candidate division TA06 bacterium]|nr:hypothetical protein [candidate division TA06 bacterium]
MRKELRKVILIPLALILAWGSPISILAQGKRQTSGIGMRDDDLFYLKKRKKGAEVQLILKNGEQKEGELEAVNTEYLWIKFFEDNFTNKVSKVHMD